MMKYPYFFKEFVAFASTFSELKHAMMNKVKPSDLTTLQYLILEQLAVSEPLTPSEIADCQHMSLPNVSRELKNFTKNNSLIDKKIKMTNENMSLCCLKRPCVYGQSISTN
ncbi:MarR family transcriptional regulator [Bacillus sp. B6(2022)]|nr:MarR family transcriptional regulator [Bacillus sp. B6(2022)]